MNNKKIDNALTKIKGNLGETKAQITKQLEDFNFENGTNYTVLDIAAALVESDTMGITLSKNREEVVVSSKKKEKGVRYFVNFGERDKATKKNVAEFLKKEIGVVSSEIIEISLMDNYGFIELVVGADDNMYKLVGKNFNGREVNVEKAGEKERGAKKQAGKKKSFEKPSKKTYASKNANGKRGRK